MFKKKNRNYVIKVVDHMDSEDILEANNLEIITISTGIWSPITW